MKIIELIQHYDRVKSAHGGIGPSLSPKVVQLMTLFGHMPASTKGVALAEHCVREMPTAKANTIARVLTQLRAVLRAGERDGLIERAPYIPMPSVHDERPQIITVSEAELLLSHIKWTAGNAYLLCAILLYTGCRVSEAVRLRWCDVTPECVTFRKLAAGRTKTIPRVVDATPALRSILVSREPMRGAPHQPWLPGVAICEDANALHAQAKESARSARKAIADGCAALGLPHVRAHDLRHVFAALVTERGGDLADIGALLGHASPRSSYRYRGLVRTKTRRLLAGEAASPAPATPHTASPNRQPA